MIEADTKAEPVADSSDPRRLNPTPGDDIQTGWNWSARPLAIILFLFFLLLVIRSAWLSEDSYISWRVVDNFVHGFGLRWNVLERVQVYTDPLFVLIVAGFYSVTHEIYLTVLALCFTFSGAAVYLLLKRTAVSYAAAIAGLAAFISSRAFIDYSTSGLENPLSFLLLAAFYTTYFCARKFDLRTCALLTLWLGLSVLNRFDAVLLVAPALAYALLRLWREHRPPVLPALGILALASSPLWLWLIFATIYYGFPFPNTYYAKLHTGIPAGDLLFQGALYYLNEIGRDSITLIVIGLALYLAARDRKLQVLAVGAGILLYLFYILKIGGDFMAGRFFTLPFLAAVALLLQSRLRPRSFILLALAFFAIGLCVRRPTVLNDESYCYNVPMREIVDNKGIADERGYIYHASGLLPILRRLNLQPTTQWTTEALRARQRGERVQIFGNIGFYGFTIGPEFHVIDPYGLADPLLSKLPIAAETGQTWRIGHFERAVPKGYPETIRTGVNKIRDRRLSKLYDTIKVITQEPVWSSRRFKEIFRINTGQYDKLMVRPRSEEPGATEWKNHFRNRQPKRPSTPSPSG